MNLTEISVFVLILVVLANAVILAPRLTGCSRRSFIWGATALVVFITVVYAFVCIMPRSCFLRAAAKGDLESLKKQLDGDPSLIRARGLGDWTALHYAARHNQQETVQYLVRHGASMDAMAMGQTPFGLAVSHGHYDCVRFMLQEGVDVDQRSKRDRATAIHIAARRGHLEIVRLLLDCGADPSLGDRYGHGTPLTDARSEAIRRLLSERGAK